MAINTSAWRRKGTEDGTWEVRVEKSLPLGAVWREALGGGVSPCTGVFQFWGLKNGLDQRGRKENKGRKR